ncbi:hypothetical protein H5410_043913 [Solanum commersonii]|uniref:Uncharacterized protein n=1 Tax=Solanum commersonii TaxID=4109 RepID=A0A9J5Y0N1_SOLCO|nr:hypothetical protein H5410_043913 [Solanum commersonii]
MIDNGDQNDDLTTITSIIASSLQFLPLIMIFPVSVPLDRKNFRAHYNSSKQANAYKILFCTPNLSSQFPNPLQFDLSLGAATLFERHFYINDCSLLLGNADLLIILVVLYPVTDLWVCWKILTSWRCTSSTRIFLRDYFQASIVGESSIQRPELSVDLDAFFL